MAPHSLYPAVCDCCRELFNNVACEAIFSDAGALQLAVDLNALQSVFRHYTARPAAHFRELNDALKLLNLQQEQADFIKQVRNACCRLRRCCRVLCAGAAVYTQA